MRLIIKDYKHWRFKYELMRFGVLALVVVLFWIGIELYSTYISTEIEEDYSAKTAPLNPALDLDMLQDLEQRREVSTEFAIVPNDVSAQVTPPTSTPRPRPAASSADQPASTSASQASSSATFQ